MLAAPIVANEQARIDSLHALGILDTPPDAEFDALVRAASLACNVPISLISLVDESRQWFKANIGLEEVAQTPREASLCAFAIQSEELLEIADALSDPRCADNPLVTGLPHIRFYAGAPLRLDDGSIVGALCVIDRQPHSLDDRQREILRSLAKAASCALESWRVRRQEVKAAATLQASEQQLRRLYEQTPAMLHSTDAEGRLVSVSDTWLRKLGYARDEVIGRPVLEFIAAGSRDYIQRILLPAFYRAGRCDEITFQMCRRDGGIIDVVASSIIERDNDGLPVFSRSVVEDVTSRRQTERALATESQRLANLIDSTGMGTWEWNVQTDEVHINEHWAGLIGCTVAELEPLSGRTWHDRIHPDDEARADALLDQHLAGKTTRYEIEFRMRHRDGHWVWVLSRGAIISWTPDGRPQWLYAMRKDISARKQQEEALRKSEDFLERIGRAVGVGGWELDLLTNELYWSAETYRIIGLPETYRPSLDSAIALYAPEDRPVISAAIARAATDGLPWDLELRFIRADGQQIWVRAVGAATIVDGRPVRLSGAFQDISEVVARRLALQQANERAKLAAESGGIGIWEWDVARETITWDAIMHRLYGLPPQEAVLGYDVWPRHLHPEDRAAAETALFDAVAGRAPFDIAFRVVWADGSIHHMRGAGHVTRDAAGRALRVVGVNWDVTESRLLAAELQRQIERQAEASERERALFQNSPDSLSIIRVEEQDGETVFRFEAMSPAFAPTTGWKPEDFIGKLLQDCLPPEAAKSAIAECRDCIARNATIPFAVTINTPRGTLDFEGSRTPIRHPTSGKIVRIAGVLRDVTERKRLQVIAHHGQKMEAIGRLAAGVAHDFNNILQSISASLELMQDEVKPQTRAYEFIEIGLRSARRGSYLTHHLLSYARKQMLSPCLIDLPRLLSDIKAVLARTLGPHIAVSVHADALAPTVRADPGQIQTAVLNLAINASHAMVDGGSLRIEARRLFNDGKDWVCISVGDTGCGMDEATLARAVEPFFTTKGVQGTGLGLSMVQGFAEQSGGRMHISSRLGVGTVVELHLPAELAAPQEAPAPLEPAVQPVARVLLVDDDPDVLVTTGAFLEKAGFAVIRVANADQALRTLANGAAVDALVTDFAMPGMNGGDLVREVRNMCPSLPAVIISGFTDLVDTHSLGEGVQTLHKPFQRDRLINALRRLFGDEDVPADGEEQML